MASNYKTAVLPSLIDPNTGAYVGVVDASGKEQMVITASTTSDQGIAFDATALAALKQAGLGSPCVPITINNPTNTLKTIYYPRAATHVVVSWRQGTGAAATGAALRIVAGAGGDIDATTKLSAGGGSSTLLLGQRRRIDLTGLTSGRLDFLTTAAETGTSELVLEVYCPRPAKMGTDLIVAPLAMLSTDASVYDESGNGNHMAFDAGLTAAAAAANAGVLTTGASTTTAAGFSIPTAVFNLCNPDAGDSYIVRVTADITPPASVCGVFGPATSGNGWKLFAWSDGRLALVVTTALDGGLVYDALLAGTLVAGKPNHLTVYVDGPNKKMYAWVNNQVIHYGQRYTGLMYQPTLKCRFAGDLDSRSVGGKWRNLRYVKCNGMSVDQVTDLVEYLNLTAGS